MGSCVQSWGVERQEISFEPVADCWCWTRPGLAAGDGQKYFKQTTQKFCFIKIFNVPFWQIKVYFKDDLLPMTGHFGGGWFTFLLRSKSEVAVATASSWLVLFGSFADLKFAFHLVDRLWMLNVKIICFWPFQTQTSAQPRGELHEIECCDYGGDGRCLGRGAVMSSDDSEEISI